MYRSKNSGIDHVFVACRSNCIRDKVQKIKKSKILQSILTTKQNEMLRIIFERQLNSFAPTQHYLIINRALNSIKVFFCRKYLRKTYSRRATKRSSFIFFSFVGWHSLAKMSWELKPKQINSLCISIDFTIQATAENYYNSNTIMGHYYFSVPSNCKIFILLLIFYDFFICFLTY